MIRRHKTTYLISYRLISLLFYTVTFHRSERQLISPLFSKPFFPKFKPCISRIGHHHSPPHFRLFFTLNPNRIAPWRFGIFISGSKLYIIFLSLFQIFNCKTSFPKIVTPKRFCFFHSFIRGVTNLSCPAIEIIIFFLYRIRKSSGGSIHFLNLVSNPDWH